MLRPERLWVIEPATFQLVAQSLNQMHKSVLPLLPAPEANEIKRLARLKFRVYSVDARQF